MRVLGSGLENLEGEVPETELFASYLRVLVVMDSRRAFVGLVLLPSDEIQREGYKRG